jgi:cell division septation protein DedD
MRARLAALWFVSIATLVACSSAEDDVEAVNPSVSEALSMPKCGAVLGSFDGTDAHSNGNDTGTGYSCAGTGAYGLQYQCVELAMRHFRTHWNLSWHGNAKDLLDNAPRSSVDVRTNGDGAHPPVPGDMIVWKNGTWGHVALVTNVRSGAIDILEQNVKSSGKATLSWDGARIGARWGGWAPAGWAHAKANHATAGGPAPAPAPKPTTTPAPAPAPTPAPTPTTTPPAPAPAPSPTWDCKKSAYAGKQFWTCSDGNMFRCDASGSHEIVCPNGCKMNPVGVDDVCL